MLTYYLHNGDTVVDFSCGANAFVPLVKQEGAKQGLNIAGRSFDIITSQNLEDFERCSWMDVQPGLLLLFLASMSGIHCQLPIGILCAVQMLVQFAEACVPVESIVNVASVPKIRKHLQFV